MTYFRFIEALEKDLDALEKQVEALEEKLEKLENFVYYGVVSKSHLVDTADKKLEDLMIRETIHG